MHTIYLIDNNDRYNYFTYSRSEWNQKTGDTKLISRDNLVQMLQNQYYGAILQPCENQKILVFISNTQNHLSNEADKLIAEFIKDVCTNHLPYELHIVFYSEDMASESYLTARKHIKKLDVLKPNANN